ncbi:transcriptional regulator with XRE-family HTH domain [Actinoplanes tereljensis]|uniref:HTH cro/C1-type domain-containing protein n=1 Tax=Paractinoplanes tereljensis TaxID=571912 RepID=A0A919TTP9_9ACTN|nr:helix-turn-helix transcriptional regulator [Actinoplanes tereljensis]GIF21499.1 hypothetical protein Ate02nite_42290 [Actinoplanes tereljensis]
MPNSLGTSDDEDQPVGVILARMRRAKRLTGAELAATVGMSQPKISRIERGKGLPDPEDVGAIARALGADDGRTQALMDRAAQLHDRMTDWRPALAGLAGQQKTISDWESTASVVRAFEPALVPGPLQTSGYAKAVLQAFQRLVSPTGDHLTESALLAAVSARVKRQEALADRSKSFHFIVGEAALKRRTYPAVEMLAQINHLRDIVRRHANVKIMVVPDGAEIEIPTLHGFALFDDNLVLVDLYNTGLISRSRQDIESYRQVFAMFEEHATEIEPLLDDYEALYIDALRKPQRD